MTEDFQKIFYIKVEQFRIQTSVDKKNIKMTADCLLESIDVVSFFNAAVDMASVNLPEEIKMNMQQNMLMLFLLQKILPAKRKILTHQEKLYGKTSRNLLSNYHLIIV